MNEHRVHNSVQALRDHLNGVPPGKVGDPVALLPVLKAAWGYLGGSDAQATHAGKLDRIEGLEWDPPRLTFTLERHGGTVFGSSRAALHTWTVDVERATATCEEGRYRQLYPRSRRLNVHPLVDEIVRIVGEGSEHEWIEWLSEDRFLVRIGRVIPDDTYQQTVTGRRKRFRTALEPKLAEVGWRPVTGTRPNTYERKTGPWPSSTGTSGKTT